MVRLRVGCDEFPSVHRAPEDDLDPDCAGTVRLARIGGASRHGEAGSRTATTTAREQLSDVPSRGEVVAGRTGLAQRDDTAVPVSAFTLRAPTTATQETP